MNNQTYNVAQAAAYLKCHPETVREMIRSGKLVAAKIGRSYCIRKIHLDALMPATRMKPCRHWLAAGVDNNAHLSTKKRCLVH